MRLFTNFVGWKSGSQSSHYQWLRVISCTFKCRVLLCSTKHLLVCWDVIATTDIHAHFFGVTFTVTASSQEQERSPHFCDACTLISARDICPEKSTCSVYHTDFVLLECFTEPVMTYKFFSWAYFYTLSFILFLDLDCLYFTCICTFVTTCLCAFIRLFCAFSSVNKHAVCAFIIRSLQQRAITTQQRPTS